MATVTKLEAPSLDAATVAEIMLGAKTYGIEAYAKIVITQVTASRATPLWTRLNDARNVDLPFVQALILRVVNGQINSVVQDVVENIDPKRADVVRRLSVVLLRESCKKYGEWATFIKENFLHTSNIDHWLREGRLIQRLFAAEQAESPGTQFNPIGTDGSSMLWKFTLGQVAEISWAKKSGNDLSLLRNPTIYILIQKDGRSVSDLSTDELRMLVRKLNSGHLTLEDLKSKPKAASKKNNSRLNSKGSDGYKSRDKGHDLEDPWQIFDPLARDMQFSGLTTAIKLARKYPTKRNKEWLLRTNERLLLIQQKTQLLTKKLHPIIKKMCAS